jgi:periplasmic protein TonB
MKKISLLLIGSLASVICLSQQIVNVVLVGDEGVTENIKKAHSFIVVKKYPDCFKRLDYKKNAPLQKLRSFSDSTLTVLDGVYMEYGSTGYASISGYYSNNLKDRDWYTYNEKGKQLLLEKYDKGVLISTKDLDTVKKDTAKYVLKPGEIEAKFKNGGTDWSKYLTRNLDGNVATKSVRGGEVIVQFVVNKDGKCVNVNLHKSVEFVLDEEAIRIIEKSPLWESAEQDGRKVNAYRRQPITFLKQ